VGVPQRGQAPEFLLEAEESVGMRISQNLESDFFAAFSIENLIYGSEPAPSKTAGNPESLRKTYIEVQ
jgi:hypothetical protein